MLAAPQERLLTVIEAVRAELAALAEGLHRRASVAAARSVLELMQDTAHAMGKVHSCWCIAGNHTLPQGLAEQRVRLQRARL